MQTVLSAIRNNMLELANSISVANLISKLSENPNGARTAIGAVGTSAEVVTALGNATAQQLAPLNTKMGVNYLLEWAYGQTFRVVSANRNANGAITSASIVWPDGVSGAFAATVLNGDFPGAIDGWTATYLGSPTKTVEQPQVTRDSNGAVIAQPAITVV